MSRLHFALISLAVTAALAFGNGWVRATKYAAAQHQKQVEKLEDRLDFVNRVARNAAAELHEQRQQRLMAEQELEDAARSAPNSDRVTLPASSVRRIFSR